MATLAQILANFETGDTLTQSALQEMINNCYSGLQAPQTITYSATPTFNYELGVNAVITLTGDITTLTMQNVPDGGTGSIKIIQDGTGSAFGINAFAHTGLTFKYLGGISPIGTEINGEANGETEVIYKRIGSVINISFGLFN